MDDVDVLAVVGACGPERARYAKRLAAESERTLIPARRLAIALDPLDEAMALAPWTDRPAGAVIEFPHDTRPRELVRVFADEMSGIRLGAVICLVDAAHLLDDLRSDGYTRRFGFSPAGTAGMTEYVAHAMLTVDQLEYASIIVLVNWEPLPTADLSTVMALINHLAPDARLRLERGAAEAPETHSLQPPGQERPGWMAILADDHDPHVTDARVASVRYEHVRPLHPQRLRILLDQRIEPGEFGAVIRSAGFCRLATRPHVIARWRHVGRMFALEPAGTDGLRTDGRRDAPRPPSIGQDLAIIGLDLDAPALVAALDETALSDDELTASPATWAEFTDPFPRWPAISNRMR